MPIIVGHPARRHFQRGYIVARLDIRGTGNSEGVTIPYEYSDSELNDGEEAFSSRAIRKSR